MPTLLRSLFTREHMIKRLKNATPLETVVMDSVFGHRPQLPSAVVPIEDISQVIRTMPVTQRGMASIAMKTPGVSISGYEPLPINLNIPVSAADVNTLRHYDPQSLETWAANKTEILRRTVRNTTEAMAAQAFSGKIEWAIQLDGGGVDIYTVDWGKPLTVPGIKKLTAADATLADVIEILTAMTKAMRKKGHGAGKRKAWAGEEAYFAILALAQKYEGSQIKVELREDSIIISGTEITLRNEEYPDPLKKDKWIPVMPSKALRMFDPNGGHQMPYCALDDFDAKLAPLPLFIKPIKQDDPSGYKLVAQSKPFPVPNMEAVAECEVV